MPKPTCIKCQCEFRPKKNGIAFIEMASFGPYKVWDADIWKCPGCGVEIVSGFGNNPIRADHFAEDFKGWMDRYIANARVVVYCYEKPKRDQ